MLYLSFAINTAFITQQFLMYYVIKILHVINYFITIKILIINILNVAL